MYTLSVNKQDSVEALILLDGYWSKKCFSHRNPYLPIDIVNFAYMSLAETYSIKTSEGKLLSAK